MLGNIQFEALKRLHDSESGIPIDELTKNWRYKDGALASINSLQKNGFIQIKQGIAYFVRFPTEIEIERSAKGFTPEELEKLEDQSRINLVYLYRDELEKVERGETKSSLPDGVRRTLKGLGVIKWKMLKLTEFGRSLPSEVVSGKIVCLLKFLLHWILLAIPYLKEVP